MWDTNTVWSFQWDAEEKTLGKEEKGQKKQKRKNVYPAFDGPDFELGGFNKHSTTSQELSEKSRDPFCSRVITAPRDKESRDCSPCTQRCSTA
eukprot:986083-Rhodomonas_salina.1